MFSLKEVQSARTQQPSAGSSYPYVELTLGDVMSQSVTQLQLDQVRRPAALETMENHPLIFPLGPCGLSRIGDARTGSSWGVGARGVGRLPEKAAMLVAPLPRASVALSPDPRAGLPSSPLL